jgi:uncharacterized protein (TIGR02266 family)
MTLDRDKRLHQRVDADLVVRAAALEHASALSGTDLSAGGLFVKTTRFLPINAVLRLTIEISNPRAMLPATCRVVYVRDQAEAQKLGRSPGMGLEILDMAAEKRAQLDNLLEDRQASPRSQRQRPDEPLTVIVVDDDARYRELAAEPFRKRGDSVQTTADGLEALSMCLKDPPDIILSDVQMPRMDGWQLLRLVRARPSLASVPVVFLTALDGDAERLRGYQLGVDAYIPKPYNPDEMLLRVHQIVRRAHNYKTSPVARTTLRGELEHVAPSSLLTFIEMERKTGVLLLIGESVARIFVREGRANRVEIEGANEPSRRAVMRILDWKTGQFEFSPQEVLGRDEIAMSVTALLLEHARLADEDR